MQSAVFPGRQTFPPLGCCDPARADRRISRVKTLVAVKLWICSHVEVFYGAGEKEFGEKCVFACPEQEKRMD